MNHLTTDESLVLNAFHERNGDRAGAPVGFEIDAKYLDQLKIRAPEIDLEEAVGRLEARQFIEATREGNYRITEGGVATLYPKHSGEGGVHTAA